METMQGKFFEQTSQPEEYPFITIGTVVDTNDPQQMGRVRVVCPALGDSLQSPVEDIPWAMYVTPFGGQTSTGTRGCGLTTSEGGISYGMWGIPQINSQAVVFCLDGDQQQRAYLGCIYDQFTPHTMPHGRWVADDHPALPEGDKIPIGPLTSREKFIEPLHRNQEQAFGNKSEPNFEWKTRAADYQVSAVDVSQINRVYSNVPDDKNVTKDEWEYTQGYQLSRILPEVESPFTGVNLDSMVYSLTSPGFHSISMDDRQENCRIRIRTTSGHQLILDDTNERLYLSTAKGENWLEMDQNGNIDVYSSNRVSIRAKKDINFTSNQTIRLFADESINMYSKDINIEGTNNLNIQVGNDAKINVDNNFETTVGNNITTNAKNSFNLKANNDFSILGETTAIKGSSTLVLSSPTLAIDGGDLTLLGGGFKMQGTGDVSILASGDLNFTAGGVRNSTASAHHTTPGGSNSPTAQALPATPASNLIPSDFFDVNDTSPEKTKWTNKVPDHEPYARTMTKNDFTHEPEFPYEDENVGRVERGTTIPRGRFWRR